MSNISLGILIETNEKHRFSGKFKEEPNET